MKPYNAILLTLALLNTPAMAYEQAFQPTPKGIIETKTIPAGKLISSKGESNYFEESNRLFMPLFRYIQNRDISMTVPVEARISPAEMYFWIAPEELAKATDSTEKVTVIEIPERTVLSLGGKGSYNEENYNNGKNQLEQWLRANEKWEPVSEPFAVYWSGPMTPWFLKSYEIQVEIREKL